MKCERELNFIIKGQTVQGKVSIGDIFQDREGRWRCAWSISYISPETNSIIGDDALSAFVRTLDFVRQLIRGSEEDGLQVWWKQPGDHGGF